MKGIMRGMQLFAVLVGVGLLVLASAAWAAVGSGTLTVSNDGLCSGTGFSDFDDPNHWDVFQGQTVHLSINAGFSICTAGDPSKTNHRFLSDNGFTPNNNSGNLGGFVLTSTVCTKRSGPDEVLGTGDDITQPFVFPSCIVSGFTTVQDVINAANQLLAGQTNSLGCSASDLNVALSNINVMFDQCGVVVSPCP